MGHKSDLIYGRFPAPKTSLLPREKRIYNWFDAGVDKALGDFEGDTKEIYRAITLRVPWWLMRLGDRDYLGSSPDFGDFEVAQAGREEFA